MLAEEYSIALLDYGTEYQIYLEIYNALTYPATAVDIAIVIVALV